MIRTPQPPTAAGEHYADAERILAALLLVKRGERDRHVQVALVHATLAVAASMPDESQATTEPEEDAGPDRGI